MLVGNITFIDDALIPEKYFKFAENLTFDIDKEVTHFVALTEYINGLLWTGDKKLITGLGKKGFTKTISSNQLYSFFDQMEI